MVRSRELDKVPRKQRRVRLGPPKWVEVLSFCLMAIVTVYFAYTYSDHLTHGLSQFSSRRLSRSSLCEIPSDDEDERGGCPQPANPPGLAVGHFLGCLYLFVAIAIVCDEFFVPALEEIAARWEVSDDVAGATLMAAGGSAPELATSLIGTFQGSDVGFGTIVGSAVFNVLFVIACCVMFTPKDLAPLKLTGWPLARDCLYYIGTLIMVAVVFGINSPGIIEGWEACFLFLLYIGYCTLMAYNENLYHHFVGNKIGDEEDDEYDDKVMRRGSLVFPSHYRAGFVQLLTQNASVFDTAGVHVVYKIKGDVRTVFDKLDTDKSGNLDAHEIKSLLLQLCDSNLDSITDEHVAEVMKELDIDQNGVVDFSEFTLWYVKSEERLKNEERKMFDEFDLNKTGHIPVSSLSKLLTRMQVHHHPSELEDAIQKFKGKDDNKGLVSWEEFSEWFEQSPFWDDKLHDAEIAAEAAEGIWGELLDFPKDNWRSNMMYLFMAPITWTLACTVGIKDVRIPGNGGWCFFEFFVAIAWIGAYSYLLVDWITTLGATIGVPAVVMGLTILAAGTSVPDLLSSVVVAKAGKGDMAVSSSIGSNIFDVCVGLPVPWMLFNIVMDCPVVVGADNLFISVVVLLGMVAAVITSIVASSWKMSYGLGWTMLGLYIVFLLQDVLRVYLAGDVAC